MKDHMTMDEAWAYYQGLDEIMSGLVRTAARQRLNIDHAGTGHGIGSSDVNHVAVGMIHSADGFPGVDELLDIRAEYDDAVACGQIAF